MSLPDLVGGGAECGPVNPLAQLGKRFGQDRGAQFDTHQDAGSAGSGFRTQSAARGATPEDAAFFGAPAPTSLAPFHVDQMRRALPSVAPNQWHADMEASFARGKAAAPARATTTARPPGAEALRAEPAWARDFLQHVPARGSPRTTVPRAPFAMGMRPLQMPMTAQYAPPAAAASASTTADAALASVSQSSWDSAFTAADAEALSADATDGDELAAVAARLLDAVQHDSSDKFQQSEFLQLMRRLRDRESEVQGAEIVDKGKSRAPTQAELDGMLRDAAASAQEQRAPMRTLDAAAAAEMQSFFAEEDAAKAAPSGSFVGDGGDVLARMREDDALGDALPKRSVHDAAGGDDLMAAEMRKYTDLGANVAGATHEWEEEMDFVGRAWQGGQGRGVAGAQASEWAKLQSDWDEFEAGASGVYPTVSEQVQQPFPYAAPEYRFHDANPYIARQHAMHAETLADTVLEHEAAVQEDPRDASRWYSLGLRQQENERETQAIAALRKAVDIDARMRDAWLALAVSYTNENDREEALEALERWISVNDTYRDTVHAYERTRTPATSRHRRLANVLMAMARSSAQRDSVDADVQVALGVLFNASGEYDKAVDCFSAALAVRPDDYILYNRIGATLSNSGRAQESLAYYQQALSLRPDFARCHFNLSISCLNLKVRVSASRLMQMYQEAAEHAYTALTLQHVSDDEELPELRGAQNNSLWEILRVALELCVDAGGADAVCTARTWRACAWAGTSMRSGSTRSWGSVGSVPGANGGGPPPCRRVSSRSGRCSSPRARRRRSL